jgi:LysR family hydrogen peroxide-inducible transcriptional activator
VLLLDDGHCFRDQVLSYCSRAKAHELEFRATSLGTLAQMVAGGAGVTLLPALAVPVEASRAGLLTRPFAAPAPARTLALVWRRRSPLAEALRRVAAEMRAAARGANLPIQSPRGK